MKRLISISALLLFSCATVKTKVVYKCVLPPVSPPPKMPALNPFVVIYNNQTFYAYNQSDAIALAKYLLKINSYAETLYKIVTVYTNNDTNSSGGCYGNSSVGRKCKGTSDMVK